MRIASALVVFTLGCPTVESESPSCEPPITHSDLMRQGDEDLLERARALQEEVAEYRDRASLPND